MKTRCLLFLALPLVAAVTIAARASAGVLLERRRRQQPQRVITAYERLVVDVERLHRRLHERELVALVAHDRYRSPLAAADR